MTAKTLEQEAREAAKVHKSELLSVGILAHAAVEGEIGFRNGYLAAAEPREREIESLRRRNADMELTQRKFGAFMHEKMDEIERLQKENQEAREMAAGAIAMTSDQAKEIKRLRARVAEITRAVVAYVKSEGCDCCQGADHKANRAALGAAIGAPMYSDGSGYDFCATPIPLPETKA